MKSKNYMLVRSGSYDLTIISLFVSIVTVCSWISIPSTIPFTLQTFAIFLTFGLLGGRKSFVVIMMYLLLGTIGVPVFSGFEGGLGKLLGPTGGYIIGFLMSVLIMWGIENIIGRTIPALAVEMAIGLFICYSFGTVWFIAVYMNMDRSITIFSALNMCVIPFVIPDVIKIVLACILTQRLRNYLCSDVYTWENSR